MEYVHRASEKEQQGRLIEFVNIIYYYLSL